ncbi:hypothetical protein [Gordonia phthalatica]|uniref:Pyrrolo-quinoline quinone n=1 Tax=Gordonia phthalatica TaxID=1136941 RepID=A0A0N9NCX3_9ACTN|nr:hypothetical protein [Gordonia phthalatica]ALG84923.1 hypothetical protein ACH46_10985 [Gordonia phthalatica]
MVSLSSAVMLLDGDGPAVEDAPGVATLDAMPNAPTERWRRTGHDLFGPEVAQTRVLAQNDDVVIVSGTRAEPDAKSVMTAVDARTGEARWGAPREDWPSECAISDNGRLACVRNARDRGVVVSRVSFLDPSTGREQRSELVRSPGWSKIFAAGDGFLVITDGTENIGLPEDRRPGDSSRYVLMRVDPRTQLDRQASLVRFSSDGDRLWDAAPPKNHSRAPIRSTEISRDLIVLGDTKSDGFSVYRIDDGELVYTGENPAATGSVSAMYAVYDGGFAITPDRASDAPRTEFFDTDGTEIGNVAGWGLTAFDSVVGQAPGIAANTIPVLSATRERIGVASAVIGGVRWEAPAGAPGVRAVVATVLADDTLMVSTHDPTGSAVQVFDTAHQAPLSTVPISFGQSVMGFDGSRLVVSGRDPASRSTAHVLVAYDVRTGAQSWQVLPQAPDSMWQPIEPGLVLVSTASSDGGSVARYAS